ncbi:hypothetical protein O181_052477 [Austropuccinia psidii MF-1]|uniref:Chromo domain-containing protein n=1 Tax=Austropuccinia psidii MF-1 TaxID=1389203 RepID=A0A9Q3E7Q7_9BASI|nr:hypothetical protein [Austropuccinia psidii MF-1]
MDKVWLACKNINTKNPTKKLSERWLGPFEVLKKVGSHAYHLKIPFQWNGEARRMEIGSGSGLKTQRGKLWYLLGWKGFSEDPERATWEPTSKLNKSPDVLKDFHSLYPDKSGPNNSRV